MDQNGVQQGQAIIQLSAKSETQTVGLRRRHLRRLRLQGHRRHLRLLVLVRLKMMMMMMTAVVVVVVVVASVSVVRLFHRRRRRRQVVVYGLHAHPTPKFVAAVHWAKRLLDTLWITKRRENPRKLQFPTRVQLR